MTKGRILVVDDDAGIRQALDLALTKDGYEVVQARDGEEAVRLWRERGADLVIVDIWMPKKGGPQVIRELRALSPAIPVIAMTDGGRANNFNPLSYSKILGAAQAIAKPFTLEAMLELVRKELDQRSPSQGGA
jgi:DNA-binding NtrC family response regulator